MAGNVQANSCPGNSESSLRYGWWDALVALRHRPCTTASFDQAERAFAIAEAFITGWASTAERNGCQPVHLLRAPSAYGARDGGLAWRWTPETEPLGFVPGKVVTSPDLNPFVYELARDGSVRLLFGKPRSQALDQLFGRRRANER